MRKPIAETVLTDGPIRYDFTHPHTLDDTDGYVVVATRVTADATIRRDRAFVERYDDALGLAYLERAQVDISDGYAVVESVYTCGCRSDGPYYAHQPA
ncbi:hypothetical protein [Frankia sp. AgW1.1]|uniref:hypothetical protein n=1 Tax=Frankia sp. AgW1.1 TaxID=1836971 RepID=UPI001931E112|nr:hypothetical protein [Frankia sp. AgW1.1]MBL7487051.1 hypothetical protein [Frankia sp. AgW1.1]